MAIESSVPESAATLRGIFLAFANTQSLMEARRRSSVVAINGLPFVFRQILDATMGESNAGSRRDDPILWIAE
jgi:hypothetical protein